MLDSTPLHDDSTILHSVESTQALRRTSRASGNGHMRARAEGAAWGLSRVVPDSTTTQRWSVYGCGVRGVESRDAFDLVGRAVSSARSGPPAATQRRRAGRGTPPCHGSSLGAPLAGSVTPRRLRCACHSESIFLFRLEPRNARSSWRISVGGSKPKRHRGPGVRGGADIPAMAPEICAAEIRGVDRRSSI